jgi:hypothetical protein
MQELKPEKIIEQRTDTKKQESFLRKEKTGKLKVISKRTWLKT